MLQFSLRVQDLNLSIVDLVFIPGMDFIVLSRPCIWMDRCWISPLLHLLKEFAMMALIVIYRLYSLVVLWFAFLPLVASTALSCLWELVFRKENPRSVAAQFLWKLTEVCGVIDNQIYSSTSRRQPRAIAKACIVLRVSYANFQQTLSLLLSLCTAGFWRCNCSFSLSPRNWCGVLRKVKKVCLCWVLSP